MRRTKVVAGAVGLDRRITGVNIIEVPDVWRWLRGGELLFTSGYPWRERLDGLSEEIGRLDQAGAAAIVFKLGAYVERLPSSVIEVADALGIPLLRIPRSMRYMDIIDPIYRQLTARRLWILDQTSHLRAAFTALTLGSQSIEAVAGMLAGELRGEVYVFQDRHDGVVVAYPTREPRVVASSRLDPNLLAIGLHRGGESDTGPVAIRRVGDRDGLLAPLVLGGCERGRLLIIEPPGSEWQEEVAQDAVAHAAELISFLLMRRVAVLEGRRDASAALLESLLQPGLPEDEAEVRAVMLGLDLRLPHAVVAIHAGPAAAGSQVIGLSDLIDRAFSPFPHVVTCAPRGGTVLGLIEIDESREGSILEGLFSVLLAACTETGYGILRAGSGRAYVGAEGVRWSRAEAMIALQAASRLERDSLVQFADLGIERLLVQIPETDETQTFIRTVLGKLLDDPVLLRTLEAYVDHGGNAASAAAALPVHRSTFHYRLTKIAGLLGHDLRDPERLLEAALALRLFHLGKSDLSPSGRH